MTCREVIELLLDYVSGDLPPEHAEHLKKHLEGCPPCVTYIETYQITIRLTRHLPCEPMPDQLKQRLERALAEIRKETS